MLRIDRFIHLCHFCFSAYLYSGICNVNIDLSTFLKTYTAKGIHENFPSFCLLNRKQLNLYAILIVDFASLKYLQMCELMQAIMVKVEWCHDQSLRTIKQIYTQSTKMNSNKFHAVWACIIYEI